MSVWRRGSVTENPYWRHAFGIARVPRDILRRRTIVQMCSQTRRVVECDSGAHVIAGVAVTVEQINQAESLLLDPARRILEELLTHASGPVAPPRLAEMSKLCRALTQVPDEIVPQGSLSIGAWELRIVPPFGDLSEEQG